MKTMKRPKIIKQENLCFSAAYNIKGNYITVDEEHIKRGCKYYGLTRKHIIRHELIHYFQNKKGKLSKNNFWQLFKCELQANWLMQRDLSLFHRINWLPFYIELACESCNYHFNKEKYDRKHANTNRITRTNP